MQIFMHIIYLVFSAILLTGCNGSSANKSTSESLSTESTDSGQAFSGDSAYYYVEKQVKFGPRVPGTEAHRLAGDWLASTLRQHGAEVIEQRASIKAFDGTDLPMRNIFGRFNPKATDRILLLAHWDSRPWADKDENPDNHTRPVDGANDGASGVGVLLEIARNMNIKSPEKGIDILFVDAEDWGDEGDDQSWALGTRYFIENPPVENYRPSHAILLDMVGSPDASFGHEYFSSQVAPQVLSQIWAIASDLGYGHLFVNTFGGAVTDDHSQLIEHGIPAIDIIDYRYSSDYQGFDPVWHTVGDNMSNISKATLEAVGQTVLSYIYRQ